MDLKIEHALAQARLKGARDAARAYERQCSWVDVDDLESEAWEGILKAPSFDPIRAPVLSARKQRRLAPERYTYEQAYLFYRRVGIRWLAGRVPRLRSPVSMTDPHSRHHLHGHVAVEIAEDLLSAPAATDEIEDTQLRSLVSARLAELMADDAEGKIACAFLLRSSDNTTAADVATLFETTPKKVYKIAERAKARIASDRTMLRLYEGMIGESSVPRES